ncbi:MAG: substrate-binding domain-containing protein [Spirochaetales bacterium]|nr:substrate-binding domain-containing protein [Spirochaetales bacterium]
MSSHHDAGTTAGYTIGFLPQLSTGFGGFQDMVWRNMVASARKRGVNALLFAGGSLDNASYNPYEKNLNLVYDLIVKERVDGLIVNYTIGNYVSRERFLEFCRGFSVPLVTIIGHVEGFPDIRVDNRASMRDIVLHLFIEHQRRRIAFIKGTAGNPDAEERFAVYRETLRECRLEYDPDLVFDGRFDEHSGVLAVEKFLQHPDKPVEAVVAANDAMAFGAINGLRARGKRVPWDVAVTGFDDTNEAMGFTPALTTVRQPFDEICDRALDILCDMIEGKERHDSAAIPARLVVRESCGCSSALFLNAESAARATVSVRAGHVSEGLEGITDVITQELLQAVGGEDRKELQMIVEEYILDVQNEHPGAFIEKLKMILQEKVIQGRDVNTWHQALYILRKWAALLWTDEKPAADAENKILQACVLVGESSKQALAYEKIMIEKKSKDLRVVGQELISTFDFEQLKGVIERQLKRLEIPSCFISVYKEGGGAAEAYLAARPEEEARREDRPLHYERHALPDRSFFPSFRRYSYAVHPLIFKERRIGYAMFELGPEDGVVYDTLQIQISSSLMGSELIRQREKTERAEKERSDTIQELVRPMLDSLAAVTATAREKIGMIGGLIETTKENSETVNTTNAAIKSVSERISKMADVVGIIDDVSARVNILAINTSIESAHAGQFGKGFAVIAGEIRKLADSIKDNTSVIAETLEDIRPAIEISRKAGKENQEAFRRLEKDVLDVAETLKQIAASMDDLSAASGRILNIMNTAWT